jgi:hypothetical protein
MGFVSWLLQYLESPLCERVHCVPSFLTPLHRLSPVAGERTRAMGDTFFLTARALADASSYPNNPNLCGFVPVFLNLFSGQVALFDLGAPHN